MTYIFLDESNKTYIAAYGEDLYEIAIDLNLSEGRYLVYETSLMPDEITNPKKLLIQGKIKFITTLTRYNSGA